MDDLETQSLITRLATYNDIPAIKKIADAHRNEVGFVMRPTLELAIEKQWLLVAVREQQIVGFCNYRHCRRPAGRTTIYEIAVQEKRGGVGRALMQALQQDAQRKQQAYIYLKCVQELPANTFYGNMGFSHIGSESGKKRALNIWRLDIEGTLC